MTHPVVKPFHDTATGSWQYVFHDPETREGAIVDPVLDYDPNAGATATRRADEILAYVAEEGLTITWILDTHPHADHFSAGPYLKDRLGAPTAIGEKVVEYIETGDIGDVGPRIYGEDEKTNFITEDIRIFKLTEPN